MASEHMTARQFVGKEIRLAREAKGLSRVELAKKFPVSESLIRWWESGRTMPTEQGVGKLIAILDLPEMIQHVLDDLVSNEVAPEWLGKWVTLEERATSLLNFAPLVIPGMLQTEEYARAVLRLGKESLLDLEERVSDRLHRRHVLTREDPPLYHVILDEAVIRRPVGGPKVMHDQLMHVLDQAERAEMHHSGHPFPGRCTRWICWRSDGHSEPRWHGGRLCGQRTTWRRGREAGRRRSHP